MDGDYPYMDYEDEEYMDGDYFADGLYDENQFEDMYEEVYQRISLSELTDKCLIPTLTQAFGAVIPLITLCIISRLTHFLFSDESSESSVPRVFLHLSSAICGVIAAHMFFETSVIYLVILAIVPYLQLCVTVQNLRGACGPMTAGLVVAFVLACELVIVASEDWHKIRGAQMVIAMKVISLGFDLDQGQVSNVPSIWQYFGYIFHPGSVIFGPWVSFQEYNTLQNIKKKKMDAYWLLKVFKSMLLAFLCVVHSTCTIHWMILDHWGRWYLAYRDAQGFRFSHYFVSYVSEATTTLSGLGSSTAKPVVSNNYKNNGGPQPPKQVNGDVRWDLTVSRPLHIELPRSITEVVSNWNVPMHFWLKNYVFRPSQHLGNFAAILITYAASSLLHGLNFQLAAVLLSLGFYSYIEHELRRKLARIFDACIAAKRCKEGCDHEYKYMHPAVIATNFCFGFLAIFHLAYLGLMFDSSETQEEGYTMAHTLNKWRSLDFASHWVALATLVIHLLI